jgi:hypothetical protein
MNVCAGAVTDSKFPILVQGFSNIFELKDQNPQNLALHETTNAAALANALLELMKVSRGVARNITIEGGVDCR